MKFIARLKWLPLADSRTKSTQKNIIIITILHGSICNIDKETKLTGRMKMLVRSDGKVHCESK